MEETSRVDRKIPPQSVRVSTGGPAYAHPSGNEKADPENAGRVASIIRELALAFGREIETHQEGQDLLVLDRSGECLRMPLHQAFRLVEAVRAELGPILDRRA